MRKAQGAAEADPPAAQASPRKKTRRASRAGRALQVAVHLLSLVPLALLVWDGLHRNLTANPIQAIELRTGKYALLLLVLSLVCSPLSTVFGVRQAVRWRRPLGLYAFLYAALHFLTFTAVDYGLDPVLLREAVFEKRYALVGFAAFLFLVPLAVTSTRWWMRRLGKRWKRLHQAVYIAAVLVIVHFIWLVKADRREPLLWGSAVAFLLVLRIPAVRRYVVSLRQRASRRLGSRGRGRNGNRPELPNAGAVDGL